ncbi:aspartyl-phosphate phosphatase Spo0E family protein [Clostridium aestuarii]|uniref:Aspartyl-phosphate phosphatase Spo0E family protein n=1 Tax=Clostridium aestuarii TaxID=338193 RepID=A0ABT4CXU0_9CLOT|nr:aspartyl-phosphate phosphatase Spo0E family protein [Clostridium aestuarii]MCY6483791.1 aspartyl-phosphate phosphatase Spo0E family protein [Clostridium aestuarii]
MEYNFVNNQKLKLLDTKVDYVKDLLYILLKYKKPTDTEVVNCSQYLDKLILQYKDLNYE